MIRVVSVVGARPNFMKVAPVHRAMQEVGGFEPILVHTGQHYDPQMSEVFFDDLLMLPPDLWLGVGSGTHASQTAGVMLGLEPILAERRPDVVVVVGDVNSTVAAALTAAKLDLPVAHVEAGLRSHDRSMPEEINRVVTDTLSAVLFAPSEDAVQNLVAEGISDTRIHMVGNVMIDSLMACWARAQASTVMEELGLEPARFFLVTLHRPSNVDADQDLGRAVDLMAEVARLLPTVLVAHPRTSDRLAASGLEARLRDGGVGVLPPLGYLDFLKLMGSATAVLTDSGGIQEETTVLGVPCITLRDRTERPVTVTQGTNTVTGLDRAAVLSATRRAMDGRPSPSTPDLWDGRAAQRVVQILADTFG